MSPTSQAMLNQGFFEEQKMPTQMGFFNFPPNMSFPPLGLGFPQFLKAFNIAAAASIATEANTPSAANLIETLFSSAATQKHREDLASDFGGP
ncbi:hypothetical protein PTKIN_Ptkin07bG0085100 [Pterospermum kingtungense]